MRQLGTELRLKQRGAGRSLLTAVWTFEKAPTTAQPELRRCKRSKCLRQNVESVSRVSLLHHASQTTSLDEAKAHSLVRKEQLSAVAFLNQYESVVKLK